MEAVLELDHGEVVDLPHLRHRHRRLPHPLAQGRLGACRLDVDDDVAAREGALHRLLDAVCDGMPLPDGRSRGDADDDVGEGPPRRLAEPQAPHLDRRIELGDRLRAVGRHPPALGP